MTAQSSPRTFFGLFESKKPALKIKTDLESTDEPIVVLIKNELLRGADLKRLSALEAICRHPDLQSFLDFYRSYDGFSLATPLSPANASKNPLLSMLPSSGLHGVTADYLPKGQWAWTIDLNKSKAIYRATDKWLVIARVENGPSCLTIFLEGANAGKIFFLCPQPHFNIVKPIAKNFDDLLARIVADPAAFFRLTRAYTALKRADMQNFGYVASEYIDDMV